MYSNKENSGEAKPLDLDALAAAAEPLYLAWFTQQLIRYFSEDKLTYYCANNTDKLKDSEFTQFVQQWKARELDSRFLQQLRLMGVNGETVENDCVEEKKSDDDEDNAVPVVSSEADDWKTLITILSPDDSTPDVKLCSFLSLQSSKSVEQHGFTSIFSKVFAVLTQENIANVFITSITQSEQSVNIFQQIGNMQNVKSAEAILFCLLKYVENYPPALSEKMKNFTSNDTLIDTYYGMQTPWSKLLFAGICVKSLDIDLFDVLLTFDLGYETLLNVIPGYANFNASHFKNAFIGTIDEHLRNRNNDRHAYLLNKLAARNDVQWCNIYLSSLDTFLPQYVQSRPCGASADLFLHIVETIELLLQPANSLVGEYQRFLLNVLARVIKHLQLDAAFQVLFSIGGIRQYFEQIKNTDDLTVTLDFVKNCTALCKGILIAQRYFLVKPFNIGQFNTQLWQHYYINMVHDENVGIYRAALPAISQQLLSNVPLEDIETLRSFATCHQGAVPRDAQNMLMVKLGSLIKQINLPTDRSQFFNFGSSVDANSFHAYLLKKTTKYSTDPKLFAHRFLVLLRMLECISGSELNASTKDAFDELVNEYKKNSWFSGSDNMRKHAKNIGKTENAGAITVMPPLQRGDIIALLEKIQSDFSNAKTKEEEYKAKTLLRTLLKQPVLATMFTTHFVNLLTPIAENSITFEAFLLERINTRTHCSDVLALVGLIIQQDQKEHTLLDDDFKEQLDIICGNMDSKGICLSLFDQKFGEKQRFPSVPQYKEDAFSDIILCIEKRAKTTDPQRKAQLAALINNLLNNAQFAKCSPLTQQLNAQLPAYSNLQLRDFLKLKTSGNNGWEGQYAHLGNVVTFLKLAANIETPTEENIKVLCDNIGHPMERFMASYIAYQFKNMLGTEENENHGIELTPQEPWKDDKGLIEPDCIDHSFMPPGTVFIAKNRYLLDCIKSNNTQQRPVDIVDIDANRYSL